MIRNEDLQSLVRTIPRYLASLGLEGDAHVNRDVFPYPHRNVRVIFRPRQESYVVEINADFRLSESPAQAADFIGRELLNAVHQSGFVVRAAKLGNTNTLDLAMACDALSDFGREDAKPAIQWLNMLARLSDDQLKNLGEHLERVVNTGARL